MRYQAAPHPGHPDIRARQAYRSGDDGPDRSEFGGRRSREAPLTTVAIGPLLAALLVVLASAAALVVKLFELGRARDTFIAVARAIVQLAAVSLVIGFVLRSLWLTAAFLALMTIVGAGTSAKRITGSLKPSSWWTAVPILAGVVPALAIILASTVVPLHPVAILPSAGILIGGAMTATSLSGRRTVDELTVRHGEYEAALSLGLGRRESVILVARPAAALALIPGMDQTRTVGLVTLPGAFVGVLLAGASPWQAGATQVLVLVALLLVQAVAVATTVELIAAGLLPPGKLPLPE